MEILGKNGFNNFEDKTFLKLISNLDGCSHHPFNKPAKDVLQRISKELLLSSFSRKIPQLVALGFWLRPAHINNIQKRFHSSDDLLNSLTSRGTAFHLPPQNVDTLFVYSWSLSFLSGNLNIVRLPSETSETLKWLLSLIYKALCEFKMEKEQIFCRYSSESNLTSLISEKSDLRMIWGGDSKVKLISKYPVRLDGLSLGFPNRNSFSILSSSQYRKLSENKKNDLAEKLYNDIYWFDQMGCGSPKAIFWLKREPKLAYDLYSRLDNFAKSKNYLVESGTSISKFTSMNNNLASGNATSGIRLSSRLSVMHARHNKKININLEGAGMFYDIDIKDISEIKIFIDRSTQTITQMGLNQKQINDLKNLMSKYGGFRLVPIGDALSFSDTWDGIDLMMHMTRKITVKTLT